MQVVKVGTSSLVRAEQNSFNLSNIARICETVRDLYKSGHTVILPNPLPVYLQHMPGKMSSAMLYISRD